MENKARLFLNKHGICLESMDLEREAQRMAADMERGLQGKNSSLAMIPTRLSIDGALPLHKSTVVIDAGGTNFRAALVRFTEEGVDVRQLCRAKMPGVGAPADWEEFIAFTADMIAPLTAFADDIGFCFSYSAEITPELDGIVKRIDKEVVIKNASGKRVCAALIEELARRGVSGKRAVLLNDTAAVLLGGSAGVDKTRYSALIGQVSGTGTNTCCAIETARIGKLGSAADGRMIVNLESGMYDGLHRGDLDLLLDAQSECPGEKQFEKLTAGAYLGALCAIAVRTAAEEGCISQAAGESAAALGRIDSAVADAWSRGEGMETLRLEPGDAAFIQTLAAAVIERSAKCMAINLAALLLLTGGGKDKPALICAEGSLVQKSRVYKSALDRYLRDFTTEHGLRCEYLVGSGSTLAGSAAAALLNL